MAERDGKFGAQRYLLRSLWGPLALVVLAIGVGGYAGVYSLTARLLMRAVEREGRDYVQIIAAARRWNATYEGVYVPKGPGVESTPLLVTIGRNPDLPTADGRILTLRTHAVMTREISELLSKESGVSFHLTSLRPVNGKNAPDEWERARLEEFEKPGALREAQLLVEGPGGARYRFMAALSVEAGCLLCHGREGHHVGDVQGAVSLTVPIAELRSDLRLRAEVSGAISGAAVALVLVVMYLMTARVARRLGDAERSLELLAATDEGTGLLNRRETLARLGRQFEQWRRSSEVFSVVLLDLDLFKAVNDSYGHVFGDLVLAKVARSFAGVLRPYDILGRIGGEEFLVIVPGTGEEAAAGLAERLRAAAQETRIQDETRSVSVTVSAGVTAVRPEDTRMEELLRRADRALYQAKSAGRDRVVVYS